MDAEEQLLTWRRLVSDEGTALMAALPAYGDQDVLAAAERLRRRADPELVAAALTQSRLRARGKEKFGADAQRLWFTAAGLEQATRVPVAALRAQRFQAYGRVADLCAGIGGDAIALARSGCSVLAVERDELTAEVLEANVRVLDLDVEVLRADVTAVGLDGVDAVFCDPSRRTARGRVFDPRSFEPPWDYVERLLAGPLPAGVKLAPGLPHDVVPAGVEAQWVSWRGEVKEAVLWSGPLAGATPRRADLLPGGDTLSGAAEPGPVRPPGPYLYEPDGAVIRAGLVGAVCGQVNGGLVDATIAYVTADHLVATPFARAYEVLEVLPFGLNRLRAALVARRVGRVVVKKRGTAVDPDLLRRRLGLDGTGGEAVVVLTRVAGAQSALICRAVRAGDPR